MGNTTTGLPWPADTAPVGDADAHIKALADALVPFTDQIALAASTGWTVDYRYGTRLIGPASPLLWVDIRVLRAVGAATLTAGANGNITDTEILTMQSVSLYPVRNQYLRGIRNGVSAWTVRLGPTGALHVTDGYPTATLAAGDDLIVQGLVNLA